MTASLSAEVDATEAGQGAGRGAAGGWRIIAAQEIRDLWIRGRGPLLLVGYSVLLSAVTYLAATNTLLSFVQQREAVNLTLQVAVAVGVLLTLIVSADAVSGERERGTLENLLLAPVSRRDILLGKLVAALSVWLAVFVVSVPYVWVLGREGAVVGRALLVGFIIGTLLAVTMAALGVLISAWSNSNKASVSVSLFILLALLAPTQLPAMSKSWIGGFLVRLNPMTSGNQYIQLVLVKGHRWTQDLSYLLSPVLSVVLAGAVLLVVGPKIVRLTGGVSA
jgi:ABC-2 type transport system permease protein